MRCKLFNCDKLHRHQCCAHCSLRGRCKNPCLNSPEKCGQVREATPHELILQHKIKLVDADEYAEIVKTGRPLGLFYRRLSNGVSFLGIRNHSGEGEEQHFDDVGECVYWLIGEIKNEREN